MRIVMLYLLLLVFTSLACWGEICEDVSLNSHYQELALRHMPTLLHERGTRYFPVSFTFDADIDLSNNLENYRVTHEPFVYIHILKCSTRVIIQYWFYYVDNPWPLTFTYQDVRVADVDLSAGERALAEALKSEIASILYHKHDWELVMVVLDRTERPISLALGAHGEMHEFAWSRVHVDSNSPSHPFVYVYAKSHAMHYRPTHPAPWNCFTVRVPVFDLWDREGYWFFREQKQKFCVEDWKGGGKYTTWEELVWNRNYAFYGESHGPGPTFTVEIFCGISGTYGEVEVPVLFYGSMIVGPWYRVIWREIPTSVEGMDYGKRLDY